MGLPIPPSLIGTPVSSKAPSSAASSRSSVQGHSRASAAGPSNPVPRPGPQNPGSSTSIRLLHLSHTRPAVQPWYVVSLRA